MICKHLLIFICDFYLITKQNNIHFTNSLYSYFPIPFGKQNEKWKAKCKRKIGHWVNEDAVFVSPPYLCMCVSTCCWVEGELLFYSLHKGQIELAHLHSLPELGTCDNSRHNLTLFEVKTKIVVCHITAKYMVSKLHLSQKGVHTFLYFRCQKLLRAVYLGHILIQVNTML